MALDLVSDEALADADLVFVSIGVNDLKNLHSTARFRREVEAASDRATQERFDGTAWLECDSWYRDETGRIVANWPGYMREYAERTAELDPDEYELVA